jgi:hypothetical protein
MSATVSAAAKARSVRELIRPEIEEPAQALPPLAERRQCKRFARQMPAVLIDGEAYHSVWCADIGYMGVKVVAPHELVLPAGKRVLVKIKQGLRSFQDEFRIVASENTAEGTALHLAL